MSASLTSGTYGHQPIFSGAVRQLFAGLFASRPAVAAANATVTSYPSSFRVRVREANEVRELARSVELHSPGFAADLYAAAMRHECVED